MKPYLACGLLTLVCASPSMAAKCDTDAVPAATLLVPYFEVEPANPNGKTTLFSVTNKEAEPALAKVVLWTDWAIPTLGFEIYLAGYDVQTINLRDILVHGRLPQTGDAVSPHSALSGPAVQFPGCNSTTQPGASPVHPVPALTEAQLEELRALHMGECSGGLWASSDHGRHPDLPRQARGYLTVDLVNRCSALKPPDLGYFLAGGQGVAANRNALTGDYFLVDPSENFAQGETAVHIEAFSGGFAPGDYTFYKRFVGGSAADEREPLGTQYSVRHLLGGAFDGGTRAIVWRDVGEGPSAPITCQTDPSWYDEPNVENTGMPGYRVYFDEAGSAAPELDSCAVRRSAVIRNAPS